MLLVMPNYMLRVRLVIQIRFGLKNIKITGEAANEEAVVTFLTELKKFDKKGYNQKQTFNCNKTRLWKRNTFIKMKSEHYGIKS